MRRDTSLAPFTWRRQNSFRASAPATGQLPDLARLEAAVRAHRLSERTRRSSLTTTKAAAGPAASSGRSTSSATRLVVPRRRHPRVGRGRHADRPTRRCDRNRRRFGSSLDRAPIADAHDVLDRLDDASTVIWDCRSADEYTGRARDRGAQRTHSRRRAPRLARPDGSRAAAAAAHRRRRSARRRAASRPTNKSSRIARRTIAPASRIWSAACSAIRTFAAITARGPNGAIATTRRSRPGA